jgi:hypothetical protein
LEDKGENQIAKLPSAYQVRHIDGDFSCIQIAAM